MVVASIHVVGLDKLVYGASASPMLSHINVGTGTDCTIRKLLETVARVVDFKGKIV